jgi:ABC-2 type transport system permease protein
MQTYLTLVRRELASFFVSLTGYVIIASVVLLLGASFVFLLVVLNGAPTDRPVTEIFFESIYYYGILLIAPPVITMRTFASEKASGTYETLMTAPVSDLQVVLAKFTGTILFYAITWLPLIACIAVVRHFTHEPTLFEPRTAITTFLGMILVGCVYLSIGCFASALTRSQIVAATVSVVFGVGLFFLSLRSRGTSTPLDVTGEVLAYISLTDHVGDFARGIIDTRQIVFYLSVTVFFLFLALKVVESRRWK